MVPLPGFRKTDELTEAAAAYLHHQQRWRRLVAVLQALHQAKLNGSKAARWEDCLLLTYFSYGVGLGRVCFHSGFAYWFRRCFVCLFNWCCVYGDRC